MGNLLDTIAAGHNSPITEKERETDSDLLCPVHVQLEDLRKRQDQHHQIDQSTSDRLDVVDRTHRHARPVIRLVVIVPVFGRRRAGEGRVEQRDE